MLPLSHTVQSPTPPSDTASAAVAIGRAATALCEAASHIVALGDRVKALEAAVNKLVAASATETKSNPTLTIIGGVELRSHVDTLAAAHLLNRKPQTLRKWACYEDGPLRPTRVNGRLAWAVADIENLLKCV